MLRKGLHTLLLPLLVLLTASCAKQAYYIDTHTRQNKEGDYLIQWQVYPGMDGHVAIYASSDANQYPSEPSAVEQIATAQYQHSTSGIEHTYFMLIFNNRDMRIVTARTIPTIGILNLRDIGGYMTYNGEQMRWGMIYRSGDLWRSFEQDIPTIAALGLRTQYSLSPSRISDQLPKLGISALEQIYIEPDNAIDFQHLIDNIYTEQSSRREIEQMHREVLENIAFQNPNQLRMLFDELIDPANYPILLSDDLGKDRVAFVTLLIHHILGVSKSDAISDYILSNDLLPVSRLEPNGFTQSVKVQEALTEYFRCTPRQVSEIMDEIEKRYGSIDNYLADYLHFDTQQQEKLRLLLLY
ncbi:MAG: tyrosine-protein phosphatase [Porphyromonas sp.]|nr:tyrosine-protein phosphatase [Porphyromonas sp.]